MRLTDEEWKQHFKAVWKQQIEEIETNITEWGSDDIDDEEKEEEKSSEETATQYYEDYGEEEFSSSSSELGTDSDDDDDDDDDDSNLSFTSEWTLHDEEDRALYNGLHKLEEEIKDLKKCTRRTRKVTNICGPFFRNCNLNKKRAATEMLRITPSQCLGPVAPKQFIDRSNNFLTHPNKNLYNIK